MRTYLVLSLLLFLHGITIAQSTPDDVRGRHFGYLNLNAQVGIPLDDFRDNLPKTGFGGGGYVLFQITRKMPLYAGIDLAGMVYDRESKKYSINVGGFTEKYTLKTNNSIFLGHAMLRFSPIVDFPVKPYIDGMIGTKNLFTRTRLIDDDDFEEEDSNSEVERGDWALSYGLALGVRLQVFRKAPEITIDLRCAYLPGANATYLVRKTGDSGPYELPIDAFEEKSSATNLLIPSLGITFNMYQE